MSDNAAPQEQHRVGADSEDGDKEGEFHGSRADLGLRVNTTRRSSNNALFASTAVVSLNTLLNGAS